jgi:hypothetical protein
MSQDEITVRVKLLDSSKRAIFVLSKGHEEGTWLPLTHARFGEDVSLGDMIDVTIPRWLARERGIA